MSTYNIELVSRNYGWRDYRVTQGGTHYNVSNNVVTDQWHVTNSRNVQLDQYGPTASKLIAACQKYFEALEGQEA